MRPRSKYALKTVEMCDIKLNTKLMFSVGIAAATTSSSTSSSASISNAFGKKQTVVLSFRVPRRKRRSASLSSCSAFHGALMCSSSWARASLVYSHPLLMLCQWPGQSCSVFHGSSSTRELETWPLRKA